ncbi:MAG TPA: zinc-ribbon domain-containing protein [Candidatus Limnocylindrales bacterium]|nr:zinc-ribbon domain-containing protein [Candidatus Limnocylindrales bacterium]
MAGKVICSKCGQENDAGETFCGSCGAFLEWSGEQVAAGPDAAPAQPVPAVPAPAPPGSPSDPQPAGAQPVAAEPAAVAPVRTGPILRSAPPGPLDRPATAPVTPSIAAPGPAAAEPTVACPACGRANPASRNFCHSCGARLRPRPAEPMAHRRRSGSGREGLYRLVSIILLIAIILVGSFLVTRLTGASSTASPHPSPSHAVVARLVDG